MFNLVRLTGITYSSTASNRKREEGKVLCRGKDFAPSGSRKWYFDDNTITYKNPIHFKNITFPTIELQRGGRKRRRHLFLSLFLPHFRIVSCQVSATWHPPIPPPGILPSLHLLGLWTTFWSMRVPGWHCAATG